MAVTEVTLRTDLGEVDVRLVADRARHTLGDVAEAVLGRRATAAVDVDGRPRPADTRLADAGLRRGSTLDVSAGAATALDPVGVVGVELEQVAGYGSGAVARLPEGFHRIGPTRRVNAPHLGTGAVDEPIIVVQVTGDDVLVTPAGERAVWVGGHRIETTTAWNDGVLVAGDRVLRRRSSGGGDDTAALLAATTRCTTDTRLPIGRRLDDDGLAGDLLVDVEHGVGVVADPDDALAVLRAMVVDLAGRPGLVGTVSIRTDRPRAWEWAKWLPQVAPDAIVRTEPGTVVFDESDDEAADPSDAERSGRRLVVVDRTSPDALPASLSSDALVVAAAPAAHQLPVLLGTLVEPVDDGIAAAVRVTTTVAGRAITYARVAPRTLDDHEASRLAHHLAERLDDDVDTTETDDDAADRHDDELRLEPWVVTRDPSPLERRILRHAAIETAVVLHAPPATDDAPWVEPDLLTPLDQLLARSVVDESRIVLPLGWWTERESVATIQLTQGRHLLLTGKPKCGRSTLISLMAEGARHASPELEMFALAPRRGPLLADGRAVRLGLDVAASPDDVKAWVERIRTALRPVVFVDDADRVGGPSLDRLGSEEFSHVTVVMAARPGLGSNHWSSPWQPALLTVHLDAPGEGALVTRHRSRAFRTISPDERDG